MYIVFFWFIVFEVESLRDVELLDTVFVREDRSVYEWEGVF